MTLPDLVTADELGGILDLSGRGVRDLAARGIIPPAAGRGRYHLAPSIRAYARHMREVAAGRGTGENLPALTAERVREARERADARSLSNARVRGELVPAAEVERTWTDTLREIRARMMALPSRIGQRLPHLSRQDVMVLDEEVRAALTEAANG